MLIRQGLLLRRSSSERKRQYVDVRVSQQREVKFRSKVAIVTCKNVRSTAIYIIAIISMLIAACGANNADISPDEMQSIGQATTDPTQSASSSRATQVTIDGYTYSISPDRILREVDSMPPGYVRPHPSFQIALIYPVDRGAKLFTDFNAHFRVAYRRTILDGALSYTGEPYDTSDCQDVSVLPDFCAFDLLAEPGSDIVKPKYQRVNSDKSIWRQHSRTLRMDYRQQADIHPISGRSF